MLAALAALLLALPTRCNAEQAQTQAELLDRVGFERLEAVSKSLGSVDAGSIVGELLAGRLAIDRSACRRLFYRFLLSLRDGLGQTTAALAAPLLVLLVMRLVAGRGPAGVTLLCRLACACALTGQCVRSASIAGELMRASTAVMDAAVPVLSGAMALTGAEAGAGILTPASALCAYIIEKLFSGLGVPLCGFAAAVAVAGNLSDRFRLKRLFALMKRLLRRGATLLIAGFTAVLAAEGCVSAAQDSISGRVLRQLLRGAVPGIRGGLAGTSDALLASAAIVKNAIGVTGMIVVLGACLRPTMLLASSALSAKITSAMLEPLSDENVVDMTNAFGDLLGLLLGLGTASAILVMLLIGACLAI